MAIIRIIVDGTQSSRVYRESTELAKGFGKAAEKSADQARVSFQKLTADMRREASDFRREITQSQRMTVDEIRRMSEEYRRDSAAKIRQVVQETTGSAREALDRLERSQAEVEKRTDSVGRSLSTVERAARLAGGPELRVRGDRGEAFVLVNQLHGQRSRQAITEAAGHPGGVTLVATRQQRQTDDDALDGFALDDRANRGEGGRGGHHLEGHGDALLGVADREADARITGIDGKPAHR